MNFSALFLCLCLCLHAEEFVLQVFTGGRFGEQLQGYLQAKWVSYLQGVPLVYTPFSYSTFLALDREEVRFDPSAHRPDRLHQSIGVSPPLPDRSVYTCYYYTSSQPQDTIFPIEIDWKNEEFRRLALKMIAPRIDLALATPPAHTVNIAIHVREGGGFDRIENLEAEEALAMKVPPFHFYLDALERAIAYFPDSPLYIHLFTDAMDPGALAERLQQAIPPDRTAQLEYRRENNRHDAFVLEDFFSLFLFDALIRSQSQFSLIPSCLHDFAVVLSPAHYSVQDNQVIIDEIRIDLNQSIFNQLESKKYYK